jgi:hypothetical protein
MLRNRYLKRALFLATDPTFQRRISMSRREWRKIAPDFPLSDPVMQLDELEGFYGPMEICVPPRLREFFRTKSNERKDPEFFGDAYMKWVQVLDQISNEFWPESDFQRSGGNNSISNPFVSAAMQMETWALPSISHDVIPTIRYEIESLPYPPNISRQWEAEVLRGQVATITEYLFSKVPDRDEVESILRDAHLKGLEQARRVYPHGPIGNFSDFDSWWHFLPIRPGISSTDVTAVAPQLVAQSKRSFGPRPLASRVIELKKMGLKRQEIANRLGISTKRVTELINDPRDDLL